MASLPPGGKPTDRIPTPKAPREIKKKSSGGGKPPASAKRDMYTNKMKSKGQPMAGKRKGGPKGPMPVPMKKTTSVKKTRTRRMIP
jgi:hypothetical protein